MKKTWVRVDQALSTWLFAPRPPHTLALFRAAYGLLLLRYGLSLIPNRETWFGPGMIPGAAAAHFAPAPLGALFGILGDSSAAYSGVIAVLVGSAVGLVAGFRTQGSAVLAQLCLIVLHGRNPAILWGSDDLLRSTGFFLIFSPAGAVWSLDARKRGSSAEAAPWALRFLQLHFCQIYLSTFIAKIQSPLWRDGTAVYYVLRVRELYRLDLPRVLDQLWILRGLTWGTLAVELGLGLLIFLPRFRVPILVSGFLMHLGLEGSLEIPAFQPTILANFLLFLDPAWARDAGGRLISHFRRRDPAGLAGP